MGQFRDYLDLIQEMSIAGYGDWTPSKEMVGTLSIFILNKNWKYIDTLTIKSFSYNIYKQKDEYILGNIIESSEGEHLFEVDFKISLREHKRIQNILNLSSKVYNVDAVFTKETMQGFGLASEMYRFLVQKQGIILLSDELQYFGARRLWSRLSKHLELQVDIIDIDKMKYIEKDVKIYHGFEDYEFDDRIWDYTPNKKDIRLLLKDIK